MLRVMLLFFTLNLISCADLKPSINASIHTDKSRKRKLNKYFTKLTDLKRFNGVVLVHNENGEFFHNAFNLNQDTANSSYVTINSQFDIHSISKLMAKSMIIELEQKGLLSRMDVLNKFIPDFPSGDIITIHHLMSNTSGLPREPNLIGVNKKELSQEAIIEWAKKEKLLFKPGENKLYSNVGYELLYYIIGELHKSTFATFTEGSFFPKLEMYDSGSRFISLRSDSSRLARNHKYDEGIVQVPNVTNDDYRQSMLYATASDLQKFLTYISNDPFRDELKNDKGIIAWSGGGDGVRSHVQLNTVDGFSFVVLANYDEIPFEKIIKDISKIMKDEAIEFPKAIYRKPVTVSDNILKQYVGKYKFMKADNMILEVIYNKGGLQLFQNGENIAELFAESRSVFYYDPESSDFIEFIIDNERGFSVRMSWKGIILTGTRL